MSKQAQAVVMLVESLSFDQQRDVIKAILARFSPLIEEVEDDLLAADAAEELERFRVSGERPIPAEEVYEQLEHDGLL